MLNEEHIKARPECSGAGRQTLGGWGGVAGWMVFSVDLGTFRGAFENSCQVVHFCEVHCLENLGKAFIFFVWYIFFEKYVQKPAFSRYSTFLFL